MNKLLFRLFLISALLGAPLFALTNSSPTSALSGNQFNPGRIIDDSLFFDGNSMTAAQIQGFLNSKVPACDTWGIQPYNGTTRGNYGASRGNPPPYNCLRDYQQNIPGRTADQYCSGAVGSGVKSAAQIIKDVAVACSVSPKVLIVTLQKEQSLITDDWPWPVQYTKATGYGCPDTAPCDPEFAGFFNQVWYAARQFQRYAKLPNSYAHKAGQTNYVRYHPNAACGGTNVFIHNQATAGLYNYTPYQPNQAALNNLYGTGDGCSAYGNRNFWRLYNDWFGSTQGSNFQLLDTPRWMQIKNDGVRKVDVFSGTQVGESFTAGRQIRFIDKILIEGKWYLRTEFNHNDGGLYGIPQDELEEIAYQPITPKWVTFKENGNRSHPASRTSIGDYLVRGTSVKVIDQIIIDGNTYYRTEFNHNNNQDAGIHSRFVIDFAPILLDGPRNFCANITINKLNPLTGSVTSSVSPGTFMIQKKVFVNSIWYYQTNVDNGTSNFFNSNDLHNVCYVPFDNPRSMRLNQNVTRFNPYTGEKYDTLQKNMIVLFSSKIFFNNQWYFRTSQNTANNIDAVVPASSISEI